MVPDFPLPSAPSGNLRAPRRSRQVDSTSRQPATGARAPAELFAFCLKAWKLDADPAELVDRVRAIEGVVRAEFNPQAKRLIVLSTLDQSVLLEALAGLGLE